MKCSILHESGRRMRIHIIRSRMTLHQADILEYYLRDISFVSDVKVYDRTGDAVIFYKKTQENREELVRALSEFAYEDEKAQLLVPEHTGRELSRQYEQKLVMTALGKAFRTLFFPRPLDIAWTEIGRAHV